MSISKTVTIKAPNFQKAVFELVGTAPLVIHRFSAKTKAEMKQKMETGKAASSKRNREPKSTDESYQESRYISKAGWDGIHAGAFRNALISACRLVGFKMTLAKLSVFIEADGFDAKDGIPLIRIYGQSETFTAHTRNSTGVVDVRPRPMYRQWAANLRIRFDADQFQVSDVINLISRVGLQVGIGAGRPDSKSSSGCGWGMFRVVESDGAPAVASRFGIQA